MSLAIAAVVVAALAGSALGDLAQEAFHAASRYVGDDYNYDSDCYGELSESEVRGQASRQRLQVPSDTRALEQSDVPS